MFARKRTRTAIQASVALLFCGSSIAAQNGDSTGYPVGPGYLYPSVGLEVGYDDNVYMQEDNEQDSFVTIVTPQVKYEMEGEATTIALKVGAEIGRFASAHDDDYLDSDASVELTSRPTERMTFGAKAGYRKGHEARGSGSQVGPAVFEFDHPDRYHVGSLGASFGYGIDEVGAPRFELSAKYEDRTYDNNRSATVFSDRSTREAKASLFYKVMPATTMTVEGRITHTDYDLSALDSDQYRLLAGVLWAATHQTEGFAKFGYGRKDFDDSSRADARETSWEVGVNWKPLSYSMFTLATSRDIDEADGFGDYIDRSNIRLEWKHGWSSYMGTRVRVGYSDEDYGNTIREDDVWQLDVKAEYRLRPGILLGAGFTHIDLDSNVDGLSYKDNVIGVQLGINK